MFFLIVPSKFVCKESITKVVVYHVTDKVRDQKILHQSVCLLSVTYHTNQNIDIGSGDHISTAPPEKL